VRCKLPFSRQSIRITNNEQRLKLLRTHPHTHSMYNGKAAIRVYWPETGALQLAVQHSEFLCRNRNLSHETTSSRNPWLYPERWSPGSLHVLVTAYTPAAATRRRAKRQGELLAPLFPVLKDVMAFRAVYILYYFARFKITLSLHLEVTFVSATCTASNVQGKSFIVHLTLQGEVTTLIGYSTSRHQRCSAIRHNNGHLHLFRSLIQIRLQ